MQPEEVAINTPTIQLDQFLKWAGAVESGGQAKLFTEGGLVSVNGSATRERRRRLVPGDVVSVKGAGSWKVVGG